MNSTIIAGKKKWTETVVPNVRSAVNRPVQEEAVSFTLDTAKGAPIYRQIIQQIENAILSGRMKPGDRLPAIRSLAVELKTNPNTIARAYNELEIRGILVTQVGSGTYIADKKPVVQNDRLNRKIWSVLGGFMQQMRDLGVERRELIRLIESYISKESR